MLTSNHSSHSIENTERQEKETSPYNLQRLSYGSSNFPYFFFILQYRLSSKSKHYVDLLNTQIFKSFWKYTMYAFENIQSFLRKLT